MKKVNRVRKSQEFDSLIHSGKKLANSSFVMYYRPKKEAQARIGITLPKKIGHAVDRNRIKRQTRMMCEELVCFSSFPFDLILIVRFAFRDKDFAENRRHLKKLLDRLPESGPVQKELGK